MMKTLYPFQARAVYELLSGKRIIVAQCGSGKTAIALCWAEYIMNHSKKTKLLIITTASKAHTTDWQDEARSFTKIKRSCMEVVSWNMAKKWCMDKVPEEMAEYVIIFDEIQRAKQGVESLMGSAFLMLTKYDDTWVGLTGTPGDKWIDFHSYFVATKKVKNKTHFERSFCNMQYYPYPSILSYFNQDLLKKWWGEIAYAPDTSEIMSQLPKETNITTTLPTPRGYNKVLLTNRTLDGEYLESDIALLHELRQMCNTKEKRESLSDFLKSLNSPIVIFYNYTAERRVILELASKLNRKVWRIDGEVHEIPTKDTISNNDIVLCHYLSGSEALNLQFCNYWLSYSYNYSYSTTLQARGRINRIGQSKPMFFYYFETNNTVEQEIKKVLDKKQDFAEKEWHPKR